eukprot:3869086-Rhodomonas_salina.1
MAASHCPTPSLSSWSNLEGARMPPSFLVLVHPGSCNITQSAIGAMERPGIVLKGGGDVVGDGELGHAPEQRRRILPTQGRHNTGPTDPTPSRIRTQPSHPPPSLSLSLLC